MNELKALIETFSDDEVYQLFEDLIKEINKRKETQYDKQH